MKNLKSVAVAVVLGSLLCSGGLAVAQSSSSGSNFIITLVNNSAATPLELKQGSTVLMNNDTGQSACTVSSTCYYTATSAGSFSVEGTTAGLVEQNSKSGLGVQNAAVQFALGNISSSSTVSCNSSNGSLGGVLGCTVKTN